MEKQFYKFIFVTYAGFLAMLQDVSMLVVVCTLAVILDCISAISLAKRVQKTGKSTGKASSRKGLKTINTLLTIYSLIMFAYLLDKYVMTMFDLYLENIVAGIFCFWHMWSILENQSSANNSRWAKVLQRVLVDKAERHFDINLDDLKNGSDERNSKKNSE